MHTLSTWAKVNYRFDYGSFLCTRTCTVQCTLYSSMCGWGIEFCARLSCHWESHKPLQATHASGSERDRWRAVKKAASGGGAGIEMSLCRCWGPLQSVL